MKTERYEVEFLQRPTWETEDKSICWLLISFCFKKGDYYTIGHIWYVLFHYFIVNIKEN